MPILSTDWQTDTGFRPFMADMPTGMNSWRSYLPSEDSLLAGTSAAAASRHYTEAMSFRTWNGSAMSSLRIIGERTGFISDRIESLGLFAENLAESFRFLDVAKVTRDILLQGPLGDVIRNLADTMLDALGSIPVAGWVIKIAQLMGRLLERLMQQGPVEYPPIPCYPWVEYSKQADEDAAMQLLSNIQGNNWSNIFLPPVGGVRGFHNWKLDRPNHPGQYNGTRLQPEGNEIEGALGYIPTLPFAVTDWQAPFGHGSEGGNGFRSVGELRPSANQLALQLWSQINKNSPETFKIDGTLITVMWRTYFEAASRAATGTGFFGAQPDNCYTAALQPGPRNDLIADATMPIAVIPRGGDQYEVRAYATAEALRGYDDESGRLVHAAFLDWIVAKIESDPVGWGEMIFFHEGDQFSEWNYPSSNHIGVPHFRVSLYYWLEFSMAVWHYNAQRWASSPVGAYVGADYPVAASTAFKDRLAETRRRVVEDPVWLQAVDVSMVKVADPALASEIVTRQAGMFHADPTLAAEYAAKAGTTIPDSEAEAETPPGAPGLSATDFMPPPGGGGGRRRNKGGGAALAFGAALGVYLVTKGKR